MCGIVGVVGKNAHRFSDAVASMVASLGHRGPDGSGVHFFRNCALGHSRLAVIDIHSGKQPILSPSKQIGVTFNGEIYGYKALKKSLRYSYRTDTDTEVLLALYEKYDSEMLSKLPGMFAFAMWDEHKHRLFCARDRFGEKPFYYAIAPTGEFIFASEIKAILDSNLVPSFSVDTVSLSHYLRKLYVPEGRTMYNEIKSLPPAHSLTFEDGQLKISPYWKLPVSQNISIDDACEKFQELFLNSVQKQMIADVDLGFFLSGGLDSTAVVGAASEFSDKLKTFSFEFGQQKSELELARKTSQRFNTEHFELRDSTINLPFLLEKMSLVYDEPFADSSNIPTYLLSEFARNHVTVVLTGDGADEILGGYSTYSFLKRASQIPYPAFVCKLISFSLKCMRKCRMMQVNDLPHLLDTKVSIDNLGFGATHWKNNFFMSDRELSAAGLSPYDKVDGWSVTDSLDEAMRQDVRDYLPGDILTKVDRAAMASGLETRAPFLDKALAEFCISLPHSLKVSSSEKKVLLRRACADVYSQDHLATPKQGFGAPVVAWLQQSEMEDFCYAYLTDSRLGLHNVLDRNFVLTKLKQGPSYQLWILLCLAVWLRGSRV